VGGAVRDALVGRAVADIDLATPRPPDEVTRALQAAGLRVIPTGLDHGTVTALSGGRGFEVTTLRCDVATDGRHATVAFTDDWIADAARRDLTFNAMSMARDGTLFDPFGGAADLAAGRVRFVGDPVLRVAEDYLRVLRYFRFVARYGRVEPDSATLAALADGVPGLARLSPERVWSELKKILATPDPVAAVALMRRLDVLQAVLPEATDLEHLERLVAAGAPAEPLLRLAALAAGDPRPLAERLRFSGGEQKRLLALTQAAPPPAADADDAELRRALADTAPEILLGRLWLAGSPAALRDRIAATPPPIFPLQGRDLLAAGLAPGPQVGILLDRLRHSWLDTGCTATREELLDELARLRGG
jgi:poly(A) polymerase/tRNA nucleotidyltransferase (CCA-adding enzyme)